MGEYNAYGKKSYEYAIGRIKATSHPVLTGEQWSRLREADLAGAVKLLEEYGYPKAEEGETVRDSIDKEMQRAVSFILELAPDEELTNLLFFEEDALNLKLFLKSKLVKGHMDNLPLVEGSFSPELLRICAETEDFSLLGKDLERELEGVGDMEDPFLISCTVDNAMFNHAVEGAAKKHCSALKNLLTEYGAGRNRLIRMRMKRLGREAEDFAYLPVSFSEYRAKDDKRTDDEILQDVNRRLSSVLTDLGYDDGMGVLAQYYFQKKNEAAALRLLFARKSQEATGGNDE
ncbi:MAG: V-type ATPase subunit [Oscillospiraceae bacterium]|jgi:vacuolar-type H+-ATPase subunit C/Vma6|nr:V-type ATPase subunit [Oscillospiraceae bacterium]